MSSILPYQSSTEPAPPSEFDYHFENELTRRLRRRFLWYCGLTIALALLFALPGLLTGPNPNHPPGVEFMGQVTHALGVLPFAIGALLAWYRPFSRPQILRLALWVYVLGSIPGVLGMRLGFQMIFTPQVTQMVIEQQERDYAARVAAKQRGETFRGTNIDFNVVNRAAREAATQPLRAGPPATSPTTAPALPQRVQNFMTTILTAAFMFGFIAPFVVLVNHTFACLIIPWTLRQSLRPAAVLLAVFAAIFVLDVIAGPLPALAALIMIAVTAIMFVPGSAFCWWRFSKLHREIRADFESERLQTLQHEMNSARRILEASLPPQRDAGPIRVSYVYEPMRQIGGDLLFVHPPNDAHSTQATIVLLDVTGHGVAAALSVNRLIGELERLFAESPSAGPADVLGALNRYVYFTMARHDMYVTAIALRVDATKGALAFASAGHPTAFLRRADGQIIALESTAFLLGIVDGEEFSATPIELPILPGDALIAYTDGASEARSDETLQMLGIDGVQSLVKDAAATARPVREWPAEMMRRVAQFRHAPPLDDTLMVAVYRA